MITSLNHHSESELIALMKQGRREAFNEIYGRYWLKLYIAAVKRLRSKDDAKDIVQDLFISLWTKRETLIINSSLSCYLFTAIKYKVINHIQSNIVKRNYLDSLNDALRDYDNSTHEIISKNDLEVFINSKVEHLSPKVKEVFELSRKENLSINEIAEKLHTSDQTVKNQLSKALKILKIHLANA
jgi:RNA polymerase sigma-70 factor, Bacteroides expansion family 1